MYKGQELERLLLIDLLMEKQSKLFEKMEGEKNSLLDSSQ